MGESSIALISIKKTASSPVWVTCDVTLVKSPSPKAAFSAVLPTFLQPGFLLSQRSDSEGDGFAPAHLHRRPRARSLPEPVKCSSASEDISIQQSVRNKCEKSRCCCPPPRHYSHLFPVCGLSDAVLCPSVGCSSIRVEATISPQIRLQECRVYKTIDDTHSFYKYRIFCQRVKVSGPGCPSVRKTAPPARRSHALPFRRRFRNAGSRGPGGPPRFLPRLIRKCQSGSSGQIRRWNLVLLSSTTAKMLTSPVLLGVKSKRADVTSDRKTLALTGTGDFCCCLIYCPETAPLAGNRLQNDVVTFPDCDKDGNGATWCCPTKETKKIEEYRTGGLDT